jgi:hypothetical protein
MMLREKASPSLAGELRMKQHTFFRGTKFVRLRCTFLGAYLHCSGDADSYIVTLDGDPHRRALVDGPHDDLSFTITAMRYYYHTVNWKENCDVPREATETTLVASSHEECRDWVIAIAGVIEMLSGPRALPGDPPGHGDYSVPSRPPAATGLRCTVRTHDSFMLLWEVPETPKLYDQCSASVVEVMGDDAHGVSTFIARVQVRLPESTFTLKHASSGCSYTARVACINLSGRGEYCSPLEVRTLGIPTSAPDRVRFLLPQFTTITVGWSPPLLLTSTALLCVVMMLN